MTPNKTEMIRSRAYEIFKTIKILQDYPLPTVAPLFKPRTCICGCGTTLKSNKSFRRFAGGHATKVKWRLAYKRAREEVENESTSQD